MQPTLKVMSKYPSQFVRPTRNQSNRIAQRYSKLVSKNADMAVHVQRIKEAAKTRSRMSLAESADIKVWTQQPSTFSPPVAPFLASVRNTEPLAVGPNDKHSLKNVLLRAREQQAIIDSKKDAATDLTASSASSSSVRSFKVASDSAQEIVDTRLGIQVDLNNHKFAYGLSKDEIQTVLVDAPAQLKKLKEEEINHNINNAAIQPEEMSELVRRQVSLANASVTEMNKFNRKQMIEIFGRKEFDTGSPEVQAALFTVKINAMIRHLEKSKKDNSTKRRLQAIISKRATVLKYLRRKDLSKFVMTCRGLGIDPDLIRA